MTEFNEQEKAELLQFIQDNFSQQELEALAILTAMALDINIQGLNINQITEQRHSVAWEIMNSTK